MGLLHQCVNLVVGRLVRAGGHQVHGDQGQLAYHLSHVPLRDQPPHHCARCSHTNTHKYGEFPCYRTSLRYRNSLLADLPLCVQATAARLGFKLSKLFHTTSLLRSLWWLTAAVRVKSKTAADDDTDKCTRNPCISLLWPRWCDELQNSWVTDRFQTNPKDVLLGERLTFVFSMAVPSLCYRGSGLTVPPIYPDTLHNHKDFNATNGSINARNKRVFVLTLWYQPLWSSGEDMTLTTLQLNSPLLSKRCPIMDLKNGGGKTNGNRHHNILVGGHKCISVIWNKT